MRFQMFARILLILLFFSNSNFGINFTFVTGLSEKELLLELKNNLIYDSSLSTKLVQWNESTDYCQWSGVKCDNKSRVSGLDLSSESISGGINYSSSLFRFVHLQSLNLAQNSFNSIELPLGFGKLAELRYLNLSNSGFTGQIPLDFSDLTRLVVLDLSTVYSSIKLENPNLEKLIHNFTRLRELYLDGVNISAKGYDWCNSISSSLPNLRVLSLSNSYITGPFDSSLVKLRSLSIIRLDGNTFSSPFPEFFADFPNLRVLTLSSCDLFGVVPGKLFQIKSLQIIDLSNNRDLEGSLPQEFPVNGSLQKLLLSYTNFSGYVSESIGSLRMLSNVDLRACGFSGQIPSSIKNLTHLVYLDLSVNQFLGSVPSFALLKYLTVLNLRLNNLTGRVPNFLWEGLENLNFLDLSENSLEGEIPASLFVLPSLKVLYLSNNSFYGSIRDSRSSSSSPLEVLDLRVNNFEGPIPRFLFELQNLSSLSLSLNEFSGSIELTDFQKLTNLVNLDLSYNNLSVHVNEKVSLSSLFPRLGTLMLASCKLRKVPLLTNQSSLMMLDLSDNHLDGEIPNWIWEAGSGFLRFLNLSHNQFNRFDLRRPVYFDLLDLSSNNFSSSLPADIGNFLKPIVFFSIANNKIIGTIPPSLCNPSRLQTLDLSNNSLHGKIPSCLLESTHIRVLNLGGNNLSGDIPDAFPVGCGLETLDFSWNVLQGKIPKSLTRCTEIEILNLSHNVLSGHVPASIGNMQKLESLDLSFNGLSGEIPKQTFPESSFLGNEGLCGSPLNKTCSGVISNKFYGLVGS